MTKDDEQWGNIELPGLSDDELFNKNWNHVAAAIERNQNPEYVKKQRAADKKRKEFTKSEDWLQKTREANSRSEWKENNLKGVRKRQNNPEAIAAYYAAQERKVSSGAVYEIAAKIAKNRDSNQEWHKNIKEAGKRRRKKVITPEGEFEGFSLAVTHYMNIWGLKKGGADYRLRQYLNDENNLEFRWI